MPPTEGFNAELDLRSRSLLDRARRIRSTGTVGTGHLLLAMLEPDSEIILELLRQASYDAEQVKAAIDQQLSVQSDSPHTREAMTAAARRALRRAGWVARARNSPEIGPGDIFLALQPRPSLPGEAEKFGDNPPDPAAAALSGPRASRLRRLTERALELHTDPFRGSGPHLLSAAVGLGATGSLGALQLFRGSFVEPIVIPVLAVVFVVGLLVTFYTIAREENSAVGYWAKSFFLGLAAGLIVLLPFFGMLNIYLHPPGK